MDLFVLASGFARLLAKRYLPRVLRTTTPVKGTKIKILAALAIWRVNN